MAIVIAKSSTMPNATAPREKVIAKPKPPRKSWQRRKGARPAEILEAALEEFSQKGFAATHMTEIAQRANITKGTIYLYYKDKEALFWALVCEMAGNPLNEAIAHAVWSERDAKGKLTACVRTVSSFLRERKRADLLRVLVSESKTFPQMAAILGAEIIDKITAVLSDAITAGNQRDELRDLSPVQVAQCCLAQILFDVMWRPLFESSDEANINSVAAVSTQIEILLHVCLPERTVA